MSDFEVHVTFTGLMMLVPDGLDVTKELSVMDAATHTPVPWTVLIPNARVVDPAIQLPPDDPGKIHEHTPFLGVDPQYLCAESTAGRCDTWCTKYTYHELDGVDVQWDQTASNLSGPPAYTLAVSGDTVCPTPENKDSLHWIPSLAEVGFAGHKFAPEFLQANPSSELIAARTRIEGGTLAACVTSPQKMNFRVLSEVEEPGSVTQALAESAYYTFRGRGRTFTVKLQPREGGDPKTVMLAPVDGRIELTVGNVPNDFIVPTLSVGKPEAADAHFGIYHRFLQNVDRRIIPHDVSPSCGQAPCMRVISRPCARPAEGGPSPEGGNCGKVRP
jgi:hypothetical protein